MGDNTLEHMVLLTTLGDNRFKKKKSLSLPLNHNNLGDTSCLADESGWGGEQSEIIVRLFKDV